MARPPTEPLEPAVLRVALTLAAVMLLVCPGSQAQTVAAERQHVRWPLLDVVMLPDSAGVWFLVAPNPATVQWSSGSHLVDLALDPVVALQWVTIARRLSSSAGERSPEHKVRVTPPLRGRRGRAFVVLGRNSETSSDDKAFILAVSDSAKKIRWKTHASLIQVESLFNALEQAATDSRTSGDKLGGSPAADPEPDQPVRVVFQPKPRYPGILTVRGRIGRVWMAYVVGADGRAIKDSFRPLLTDHPLFTEAAIDALQRSRFKAALVDGRPVPQRVFQIIVFRIQ